MVGHAISGKRGFGAFSVGLSLAALTAGAAQADTQDMVDALADGCAASSATVTAPAGPGRWGTLRPDQVQAAVYKAYAVDSRQLAVAGGRALAARVARTRRGEAAVPAIPADARPLLNQLWDQVEQWGQPGADNHGHLRTLAEGGLMIVDNQGRPTSDRTEELLGDILVGESNYTFICRMKPPVPTVETPSRTPTDPPPAETDGRPAWVLVKTRDGLGETSLEDKEFAEFSYTDDQEAGDRTFGLAFTAGARFDETTFDLWSGSFINAAFTPYVSFDRQGGDDPTADGYVNNLNFGLQAAGAIQLRGSRTWLGYYSLSYAHETDGEFESDANSLELKLDPPLPVSWPYHRMFSRALGPYDDPRLEARWTLEGVADWVEVDDPGQKKSLTERTTYRRLGYDLGLDLRFHPSDDWHILWTNQYQVREGQTSAGGDAELFSSSLLFKLSKDSHYSFGLNFENGRDLQSLEPTEVWKLVIGLRY